MLQPHSRRSERAKRAHDTVTNTLPEILRATPRARHGIHLADLVLNSTPNEDTSADAKSCSRLLNIRVQCADTLTAAARMSARPFATRKPSLEGSRKSSSQRPNVAVLNMASSVRPGGGFLDGANSQEEFLCARTTLYPSLWESFYPLPEIGGIFSPDVLVFRDQSPAANDLGRSDRFFVDVISAGMFRFPGLQRAQDDETDEVRSCSCGVSYCDRDRDLVMRKMIAVLRLAQDRGAESLVLGAWGCGAYGNPVREIAKLWRRVITGGLRPDTFGRQRWNGIREITFAIPDLATASEFESVFGDLLSTGATAQTSSTDRTQKSSESSLFPSPALPLGNSPLDSLVTRIAETELQLEQSSNPRTRARLRAILADLTEEMTRGLSSQPFRDDFTLLQDEHNDNLPGLSNSSGEENSFFNFDENDIASESSDGDTGDVFVFGRRARSSSHLSQNPYGDNLDLDHDRDHDEPDLEELYAVLPPSPSFNPKTGWYSGSIDQFHKYMRAAESRVNSRSSPHSPYARDEISGLGVGEESLQQYLNQYVNDECVAH